MGYHRIIFFVNRGQYKVYSVEETVLFVRSSQHKSLLCRPQPTKI